MKGLLLNTKEFEAILSSDKIVILDGGARGDIFAPFNQIDKKLIKIVRFEPDPNANIIKNENEIIIPKGIWKNKATLTLNIAVSEASSSVYPFNIELQKYIDPLINKRKIKETTSIECISIDEFVSDGQIEGFDFIKLDIHGAEYEALEGAKNTLKNTLGLLVESWTIPIHKGQKVRAHVESLIYDNNFFLFEEYAHSNWARYNKKHSKKQPISIDSLYFIDPIINDHNLSENQILKLIGIADLFGHVGYALQLNNIFKERNQLDSKKSDFISSFLEKKIKEPFLKKYFTKAVEKINQFSDDCAFR